MQLPQLITQPPSDAEAVPSPVPGPMSTLTRNEVQLLVQGHRLTSVAEPARGPAPPLCTAAGGLAREPTLTLPLGPVGQLGSGTALQTGPLRFPAPDRRGNQGQREGSRAACPGRSPCPKLERGWRRQERGLGRLAEGRPSTLGCNGQAWALAPADPRSSGTCSEPVSHVGGIPTSPPTQCPQPREKGRWHWAHAEPGLHTACELISPPERAILQRGAQGEQAGWICPPPPAHTCRHGPAHCQLRDGTEGLSRVSSTGQGPCAGHRANALRRGGLLQPLGG